MKKLTATILLTLLVTVSALARKPEIVVLKAGEQKIVGDLRLKFVGILDDSRCPANARCIWAGNARVAVQVAKGRSLFKTYEMNTNLKPQEIKHAGFVIRIAGLSQDPNGRRQKLKDAVLRLSVGSE